MKFVVKFNLDSVVDEKQEANWKTKIWLDENGIEYTEEIGACGHRWIVTELKTKEVKYLVKSFGIDPTIYC